MTAPEFVHFWIGSLIGGMAVGCVWLAFRRLEILRKRRQNIDFRNSLRANLERLHAPDLRDHAAARQSLLEAVALDPQSYEAQLHLGRVELAEGRLEQAELRLLLASLLGPKKGYALSLLGDCYALADKVPQAIAVLERLLVLDPENGEAKESLERLKSSL